MKSKFSIRSFLLILIFLFLSLACEIFTLPITTFTPASTKTPKPTSTPTFTPTPILPDISEVVIEYEDLPSNFYIETISGSTRTVKRYAFATTDRSQIIQGMTFIISTNGGEEKINSYFDNPKKLIDTMFEGSTNPFENITINPNINTYGERSAIVYGNTFVNDLQVQGEFIFIQKGDIGALISVYYPQGRTPEITLDWLAKLVEERMNAVVQ